MSGGPGGPDEAAQRAEGERSASSWSESHFTPYLTTTFTPPPSCVGPTFTLTPNGADKMDYVTQYGNERLNYYPTRGLVADCYPPYFYLFSDQVSVNGSGFTKTPVSFYSPGICPRSYAAASQQVDGSGQTTTTCCPESFSLFSSTDSYYTNWTCGGYITTPIVLNGSLTSTGDEAVVAATPITIINGPRDSTLFVTLAPASGITTAAPSRPSTGAVLATSTSAPQPTGLSKGAQAGIGVGVILGAIVIFLIGFLVWRRKTKQKANPQQGPETVFDKAELSGQGRDIPELDRGNAVYEANGATKPPEMATDTVLAELDGNWRGWEAPWSGRR